LDTKRDDPSVAEVRRDAEHIVLELARREVRGVIAVGVASEDTNVRIDGVDRPDGDLGVVVRAGTVVSRAIVQPAIERPLLRNLRRKRPANREILLLLTLRTGAEIVGDRKIKRSLWGNLVGETRIHAQECIVAATIQIAGIQADRKATLELG